MPFSIETFERRNLTVITATGTIVSGEPLETIKRFYSGKPTKDCIWDFRAASMSQMSTDEIQLILDHALKNILKRQFGKTALVAPGDHDFERARMTTSMGDMRDIPWELRAFRTMDEATLWLGVRYPEEEQH
jgi:hypothetical protein